MVPWLSGRFPSLCASRCCGDVTRCVGCVSKCPSDGEACRELGAPAGCAQTSISLLPLAGHKGHCAGGHPDFVVAGDGALSQGVVLLHGLMHRSQSLQLKLTLEFQPVQYSSLETAAMPWPSARPGVSPWLLSKCSQAQQSKMISRTASSESKKQPLTSTRL